MFNFPKAGTLQKAYESLDPWQLADFTQKMAPNAGKLTFTLRKKPQHQNIFFDISEVIKDTYVSPTSHLSNLEAPNFSENNGGVIGNKRFKRISQISSKYY